METIVKVISIKEVTHNVRCIRMEKPRGYKYKPGQASDVSIDKPDWTEEKRPFTFTALNDAPYLEFTIKCYTDHKGVTNEMSHLQADDYLIIDSPWGTIEYKGEGYFIAGGAGVTPFIAILRRLCKDGKMGDNQLFFSNKTREDIIYEDELNNMMCDQVTHVITDGDAGPYAQGYIDEEFLKKRVDFGKRFYICGPDKMIASIKKILTANGAKADEVVFEK